MEHSVDNRKTAFFMNLIHQQLGKIGAAFLPTLRKYSHVHFASLPVFADAVDHNSRL